MKYEHIWVPDFRHILQNPKVSSFVMGFNNHAQRFTEPNYLDVDNPLHNNKSQWILIYKLNMSRLKNVWLHYL